MASQTASDALDGAQRVRCARNVRKTALVFSERSQEPWRVLFLLSKQPCKKLVCALFH